MKLEIFFNKFDQFADAPDAVQKMRELVLQLAVQGMLVERKENDGNAARIFSEGLPPETAPRYEIADNWIWIRFAAVGEQRLGKMLDQKGNRGELKPYLRNTNVQWMRFQLDDIKELRLESDELEEYRLLPGDLLICEGGEPGRCAIWRDENREMYFQKAIHRVRPRKGILSEYLAICLQVDAQNGVLAKHFTGATIKHLTGRSLSEYSIPLPPLAEQKRIVAKVDELMALCDRLGAQQQERETRHAALARASLARFADAPTPANLQFLFHPSYAIPPADLRKSILTLAVQGKLVPQDPNDEPADELLKRVDAEREQLMKSNRIRRQDLLGLVADDAIPFDIPASWQWRYLADVCFLITDGAHHTPQYLQSGVPFLSVKDVSSGTIDFSSTRYISEEAHRELCKRCRPELGDILLTKVGTTGIAVTVDEDREFSIFVSLALLKFSQPNLDGRFLKHLINSPFVKQQSADNTQGIGNKNLVLRLINRFVVAIPPLAEQRRIVAKVEQLMALVDELEMQLTASDATAANLLSAVVAELTT
jgi:type I restriction enzyme, S subunit